MVSDTHVTPADPGVLAAFVAFLRGPAREADRLIVAGDLFEVWVTPAQERDPGLAPVFEAFDALLDAGVTVDFVPGNRDFAAAPVLRRRGLRVLPAEHVFTSGGRTVVVAHGDRLCSRDVGYQAFRRFVRTRLVRHVFERIPSSLARRAGRSARDRSQASTARKAYGDMGLAPRAVASLLRRHDADVLVCGHVHWGRRHRLELDGLTRDVLVLSAWEDRPTYARIRDGRVAFLPFEGPANPGSRPAAAE